MPEGLEDALDNLNKLVLQAYALDKEIKEKKQTLKQLEEQIAPCVPFKDGIKTGHLNLFNISVKMVKKNNVKWDQIRLETLKQMFPQEFGICFKQTFEPKNSKVFDAISNKDFNKGVDWCKTVTSGTPSIDYEPIIVEKEV